MSMSQKTSGHIKYVLRYFVPRQKTYQIQAGENPVNKDHWFTMQMYIELL